MTVSRATATALVWTGLFVACSTPPVSDGAGPAGATRPNVVLISIDTLRSDRLPAYGYGGVETPAIDRLARDGVLFERAFTHANLTLPSHVSLFTGLLPPEHGVRDNIGYRLDESRATLPAELRRHGYSTGGFVSSYVLRPWTGIDRGFDVYNADVQFDAGLQFGRLQRPGLETLAAASEWLDGVGEPFFLFLHLYEPHAPYTPPSPYAERYDDPYDGEVAAADAVVGDLVRKLEQLGLYEDAVVILLSDHGEGLMDHGEMDHLIFVYREVLQVPLIVKLPGSERGGERVGANVQLADVAPTIYRLLDLDSPPGLTGEDLLAAGGRSPADGPRRIVSESVYPRIHFGWSDLASVIEGDLHFIDSPDPELFRLSEDPGEQSNVIQQERAAARRLRAAVAAVDRTLQAPAADPETRRRLQALGYLSGGAGRVEGPFADPKSRIGVVAELSRAGRLLENGQLVEAGNAFREVLADEPQLVLAWQQLGEVLERQQQYGRALEAFQRAFEASGAAAVAAGLKAAELLLQMGRIEEARRHALAVVDGSPLANDVLAQAALAEGDLGAAEKHLERAIADRGQELAPMITKAAWLNALDRFEEALTLSGEVLEEFGERDDRETLGHLFLYRGTAFAALDRSAEAGESYREAISLRPRLLGAYSSLAFLHALENRPADAGGVLQEMVTANPEPAAYAEAVRTLRAMRDEESASRVLAAALRRWPDASALLALGSSR